MNETASALRKRLQESMQHVFRISIFNLRRQLNERLLNKQRQVLKFVNHRANCTKENDNLQNSKENHQKLAVKTKVYCRRHLSIKNN